jgi:hypothetical protein
MDHRRRVRAGVRIALLALERRLPDAALTGAKLAARSALLALAGSGYRPAKDDLDVLRKAASARHGTASPACGGRPALAEAALEVIVRLPLAYAPAMHLVSAAAPRAGDGDGAVAEPD